jgi:hypothetical protein
MGEQAIGSCWPIAFISFQINDIALCMESCETIKEQLPAYIYGELKLREADPLREHFKECRDCREALSATRSAMDQAASAATRSGRAPKRESGFTTQAVRLRAEALGIRPRDTRPQAEPERSRLPLLPFVAGFVLAVALVAALQMSQPAPAPADSAAAAEIARLTDELSTMRTQQESTVQLLTIVVDRLARVESQSDLEPSIIPELQVQRQPSGVPVEVAPLERDSSGEVIVGGELPFTVARLSWLQQGSPLSIFSPLLDELAAVADAAETLTADAHVDTIDPAVSVPVPPAPPPIGPGPAADAETITLEGEPVPAGDSSDEIGLVNIQALDKLAPGGASELGPVVIDTTARSPDRLRPQIVGPLLPQDLEAQPGSPVPAPARDSAELTGPPGVASRTVSPQAIINRFDYSYPTPTESALAAQMDYTVSPLVDGKFMLRVGLQAAAPSTAAGPGISYTLILHGADDGFVSAGLLPWVLENLRKEDQVTIIRSGAADRLVVEDAPATEVSQILFAMQATPPAQGAGALADTILSSVSNTGNGDSRRQHVVMLTTADDISVSLSEADSARLERKWPRNVSLSMVSLSDQGADTAVHKQLQQTANECHGTFIGVRPELAACRKALLPVLRPAEQAVASDVHVQVKFNSEMVRRYRPLHQGGGKWLTTDAASQHDWLTIATFAAGEARTGLYEVELRVDLVDQKDIIVECEVVYVVPGSKVTRSEKAACSVLDGYSDFSHAPPSLQLAVVAGGVSEALATEKSDDGEVLDLLRQSRKSGRFTTANTLYLYRLESLLE